MNYTPHTEEDIRHMLDAIGLSEVEALFGHVPEALRLKAGLDLPEGIDGLFPGMFVKASLVTGEKEVLLIPQQSIVYRSEVTAVYVVNDDGSISFRHIRIGRSSNDSRIVLSGLNAGEKVALDPIQAGIVLMRQRRQQDSGMQHE